MLSSLGNGSDHEAGPAPRSYGAFLAAVAGIHEAGFAVSFPGLYAGESRRRVALPDYPFERQRYWIELD